MDDAKNLEGLRRRCEELGEEVARLRQEVERLRRHLGGRENGSGEASPVRVRRAAENADAR